MAPRKGLSVRIKKRAFTRKVKDRIEKNLITVGVDLVKRLQAQVATSFPPASRVGESPHKRTGNLQRGFKFKVKRGPLSVSLRVFTDVVYAARLEFGFVGTDRAGRNINQGPRPYWRPVLSKSPIGPGVARDP